MRRNNLKTCSLLFIFVGAQLSFLKGYFEEEAAMPRYSFHSTASKNRSSRSNRRNEETPSFSTDKEDSRPWAIVHPGPHKTSSTTIQNFLMVHANLVEEDNFAMPKATKNSAGRFRGSKYLANFAICLLGEDAAKLKGKDSAEFTKECKKVDNDIEEFLNENKNRNRGVILSAEGFDRSESDLGKLMSMLDGYRVHAIVNYRRFYEWLPSYYFQKTRFGWSEYKGLVDWMTFETIDTLSVQYTGPVYDRLASLPGVHSVSVPNLHHPSIPILESFFCEHVPFATSTCNKLREDKSLSELQANKKFSLHPYHIVKEADRVLIPRKDKSRRRPNHKLQDAINSKLNQLYPPNKELPTICVNDEIREKILLLSIAYEKRFNPTSSIDELKQDFEDKWQTLYCSIDAKTVIARDYENWKKFFGAETIEEQESLT